MSYTPRDIRLLLSSRFSISLVFYLLPRLHVAIYIHIYRILGLDVVILTFPLVFKPPGGVSVCWGASIILYATRPSLLQEKRGELSKEIT